MAPHNNPFFSTVFSPMSVVLESSVKPSQGCCYSFCQSNLVWDFGIVLENFSFDQAIFLLLRKCHYPCHSSLSNIYFMRIFFCIQENFLIPTAAYTSLENCSWQKKIILGRFLKLVYFSFFKNGFLIQENYFWQCIDMQFYS